MRYFRPLFSLLISIAGLSLSVDDLAHDRGSWIDYLLIILHLSVIWSSLETIDKRAITRP